MSRKVGLGDTHFEADVDGDVDFAFFGESEDLKQPIASQSSEVNNNSEPNSPLSSSSSSCTPSSSSCSPTQRGSYNVGDSDFESESEITDVSPLSSANMSPLPTESPKQVRSAPYNALKKAPNQDPVDMKLLAKAIVEMDEQRSSATSKAMARTKPKKNRSFPVEETRRIEMENQRLLRRLLQNQQRKPSAAKGLGDLQPQMRKVASSAVNRRRKQQQIEEENLGLLKRLQAAKPTKELSRNYLLRDGAKGPTSQQHQRPATSSSSRSSTACPSSYSCPSLPTAGPLSDAKTNKTREAKSRDSS